MPAWLVMKSSDGNHRPFPVRPTATVIGRETRCDVRIAIPTVSDRHCEIKFTEGELRLHNLDATRHTLHNGTPVREAVLAHRDTVTVGPVTFEVLLSDEEDGDDTPPRDTPSPSHRQAAS